MIPVMPDKGATFKGRRGMLYEKKTCAAARRAHVLFRYEGDIAPDTIYMAGPKYLPPTGSFVWLGTGEISVR